MKFIASQNLDLINEKGKQIMVKKGEIIPKEYRRTLLLKNRNFIADLTYKDGIPQLTKEEEKEYNITFGIRPEEKGLKGKIKGEKYTQEKLTRRLNRLKDKGFKAWAEKEFGEDKIDRRKSARGLITQILTLQEEAKR